MKTTISSGFSSSAIKDLQEITRNHQNKESTPPRKSASGPEISPGNLKAKLSRYFEITESTRETLRFSRKKELHSLSLIPDQTPYKWIAREFVEKELSGILGECEIPAVLSVKEKYLGENFFYQVAIGRLYKAKPIFNSRVTVDIDPFDNEILAFTLKKWYPSICEEEALKSTFSEIFLKNKIEQWLKNQLSAGKESPCLIQGINKGWKISSFGDLSPALLVYGIQNFKTPDSLRKSRFRIIEAL